MMSSKSTVDIVLVGYMGLIPVCRITLGRFYSAQEANKFYKTMTESGTDKTDRLKRAMLDFFDAYLVFVLEKELH